MKTTLADKSRCNGAKTSGRPIVSLILPVHNQADHIEKILENYLEELARLGVSHEVLLIPNGSKDRSFPVCEHLAANSPFVRCSPVARGGWGSAVRRGICEAQGDVICYTNSARTQPDDLKRILEFALANPGSVVKAVRVARESLLRGIGSLLYNHLCEKLFDLRAADVNGTPKAFPRAATQLRELKRDDDLIDLEFMWRCRHEGLKVTEVPIYDHDRHGGKSTTGWRTAWRLYSGAIRFWYEVRFDGPRY